MIPWAAIAIVGFVVGRDALHREQPARFWLKLAGVCLALFFAIRLAGGYGNAYAYTRSPAWRSGPSPSTRRTCPSWPGLSPRPSRAWPCCGASRAAACPSGFGPFVVFGRVPFFFYVVHFYVLGLAAAAVRTKWGLPQTYLIWLLLLALMVWPCAWYYRVKQDRPNWITRYV